MLGLIFVGGAGAASATSITVPLITGAENLTSLAYTVFSNADISTASIAVQGSGETTDAATELVIDITGGGISNGEVCVVIITDISGVPLATNRGAVCFGTAVA